MKHRVSLSTLVVLRVTVAALIAAHGWARLLSDGVTPFAGWLGTQGVPCGACVAHGITWFEILGTPVLAMGRVAAPLCVMYALLYLVGIVMVHAPAGWFVVGLGRNGAEYSVLLIVCLTCIGLEHYRAKGGSTA